MNIQERYFCSKCMRELPEECVCPFCGYDPMSPASDWALEEGTLFQHGRYQLGSVIGAGGFGITYAAWDHTLQVPVAIKEYFPSSLAGRDTRISDDLVPVPENRTAYELGLERFRRESRILASLQNVKSVVDIFDWFDGNQTAYLVMEFVRGVTIDTYTAAEKPSPEQLFRMLRDAIDALDAVHRIGVLHRDISPSNLMVKEDGSVTLIDFGSAALLERRARGSDRTILVNKAYAALEQYDPDGEQGPWTDVYGISATIYALLTGHSPPEAVARREHDTLKPPREWGVHLKKSQEKALMAGLAVQPSHRIRSMAEFRSRLYNLPLPEDMMRRQRLIRRICVTAALAAFATMTVVVNMTYGFPMGQGVWYSLRGDGFHVVGYSGNAQELRLPEHRLFVPVSAIESGVFRNDPRLEHVEIPGTVYTISDLAFSGCANLEMVQVGEGNRTIGEYAFSDCAALHTVWLPSSTRQIAGNTFVNTTDRLTLWGPEESMAQKYATEAALPFSTADQYSAQPNDSGLTVLACRKCGPDVDIPDYIDDQPVTALAADPKLFSSTLESVALPLFLEELPGGALTGRKNLTVVELNSNLEKLGDNALSGTGVSELLLPEKLTAIGEKALYQTPLRQLALPAAMTSIGRYAFAESFLEEIVLPDGISQMGAAAFSSCVQLRSVRLPAGLSELPAAAFEGCSSLEQILMPQGLASIGELAFSKCSALESIRLPDDLITIGPYAFSECVSLQLVYIPPSVSDISLSAFDGCPASLVITGHAGSEAERYAARCGMRFMDMDTWPSGYQVSSSDLLYIVEDIQEDTVKLPDYYEGTILRGIMDARRLTSREVVLPADTAILSTMAFSECTALEKVDFAPPLEAIGAMTFWRCENLQSALLPEGLESIGSVAFAECSSLSALSLPDSLQDLGWNAFAECSALTEVELPAGLSMLGEGVFAQTGLRTVTIPGNITKCRTSFYGCRELRTVTAEEGVRALWGTFAGCDALTTVILPESLQQVSRSTFRGCSSLRDVWIYSMDVDLDFSRASIKYTVWNGEDQSATDLYLEQENPAPLFADCPNVTIHGYPGSTAEAYAREYGIPFEPI